MHILRDPSAANRIANPEVRSLIESRFREIGTGELWNVDRHGYFIVAEPCDRAESLEQISGCAIVHEPFENLPYGDPDFTPSFDILEEHTHVYEMLFVVTDDCGITLFIPKAEGIDVRLLALCAQYAVRPREIAPP